ncbi:MAG: glucosyltransferase domain-containing protein, partial [Candidatus Limivicinus sp.]
MAENGKTTWADCLRDPESLASRCGWSREAQLRLLLSFLAVFLFGLAAHAYGFLRAGYSHDMLNALVVEPVETYWKMQLGRPGIVLYRRVLRGLIAAPWQLGLLSLVWLSLSCFLITGLFRIPSRLFTVLVAGMLTANLSLIAMTATFLYEMDADLFAMLIGICAVWLWDRGGWKGALAGVLLITFCVGTYQSMVSVPITLIMLLSMAALLRGERFQKVFRKGTRALVMLALGGLLYWVLVYLMCSWKGINLAMDSYNNVSQTSSLSLFGRIAHVYATWAAAFWNPARSHVEPFVLVVNSLLALLGLWHLLDWLIRGRAGGKEKLLLGVLVLLLPLGMNTAQLSFSRDVHDLMKTAFWLSGLAVLLPVFLPEDRLSAGTSLRLTRAVSVLLLFALFFSNIQTANVVYTRKNLEQNAALSLMTRVLYRMEEREDYVPGETVVVFAGVSDQLQDRIPGFEATYDITGCEQSSPIEKALTSYNYHVYAAYFRYILNNPAVLAESDVWNRMQQDERVRAMSCYPDTDCMQMLDGMLIVKLGDSPLSSEGVLG